MKKHVVDMSIINTKQRNSAKDLARRVKIFDSLSEITLMSD